MDYTAYLNAILALVFVLGLIGIVAFCFKKLSQGNFTKSGNSKKRISIQEVFYLDTKRKLVIVKRDNEEHLILLGANSETIVERNINSEQSAKEVSE
jgi:flagellar protein FliO/FliZ